MILDGKQIAATIRGELREQVQALVASGKRAPKLAVVIVGHNPASETYVANKMKACAEVGIEAEKIAYDEYITEQTLLTEIQRLNNDSTIDGQRKNEPKNKANIAKMIRSFAFEHPVS